MLLNFKDMKYMKTLYSLMKKFEKSKNFLLLLVLGTTTIFLNQSSQKNSRLSEIYMILWDCIFLRNREKKFPYGADKALMVLRDAFGISARAFEEAFDLLQNLSNIF